MAKRAKKDNPIFGVVRNGTIVGAFQYDQERLMSFRNGAQVAIHVEYHGTRPLETRWYAIIGTALKVGGLPWTTKDAADQGFRDALEMFRTVPPAVKGGKWTTERMSLHDLDDDELEEKIELLLLLIYRLTGVNPDDFKAAIPHHAPKDFKTISRSPAADNQAGEGGADSSSPDPAESGAADNQNTISSDLNSPNQLADENPAAAHASTPNADGGGEPDATESTTPETGAPASSDVAGAHRPAGDVATAGTDGLAATDVPAAELTEADKKWMRESATLMLSSQPKHEQDPALAKEAHEMLFKQCKVSLNLMPRNATEAARRRVNDMKNHCVAVNRGEVALDKVLIAKLAEAGVAEIEPPSFSDKRPQSERKP